MQKSPRASITASNNICCFDGFEGWCFIISTVNARRHLSVRKNRRNDLDSRVDFIRTEKTHVYKMRYNSRQPLEN